MKSYILTPMTKILNLRDISIFQFLIDRENRPKNLFLGFDLMEN